jgi:hypothetical protein
VGKCASLADQANANPCKETMAQKNSKVLMNNGQWAGQGLPGFNSSHISLSSSCQQFSPLPLPKVLLDGTGHLG